MFFLDVKKLLLKALKVLLKLGKCWNLWNSKCLSIQKFLLIPFCQKLHHRMRGKFWWQNESDVPNRLWWTALSPYNVWSHPHLIYLCVRINKNVFIVLDWTGHRVGFDLTSQSVLSDVAFDIEPIATTGQKARHRHVIDFLVNYI